MVDESHGQAGAVGPDIRLCMRLFDESRLTLRLALPLMIGQLSQMLLGVVDTLMIGRLGVNELAALAFANSLFHVPFVFGIGVLTAVSVLTSNARGAEDPCAARDNCRHGLMVAGVLGIILLGLSWLISTRLGLFGQPSEVSVRTTVYFRILMVSVVPALASIALKNHADALNRPWPPFWIFLGGVGLNVGLNWVMIYGNLGCPRLGFEGAAWATLIARTAILLGMAVWLRKARGLRDWVPRRWLGRPEIANIRSLLSLGAPASVQMLVEVAAFSAIGLLMGGFGPDALAAHQIAITLAGTLFMIPLGLSMALSVRIGTACGAGEMARVRPIVVSGWLLITAYALLAAAVMLFFGRGIASWFTSEPAVINLTASLLVIVGVFQWVDGLQVSSSSMLRGLHDARVPALIGLVSYWIIGLPMSAGLAFGLHLGALGVWWGLAAGLCAVAVTLVPRLWKKSA